MSAKKLSVCEFSGADKEVLLYLWYDKENPFAKADFMDIKCTQNMFKSANGAAAITYYILAPEGVEARGIVQIAHGMCEYFSRYTVFAKYLCSLGFIVCGNDHLGHGASVSRETEFGFFAPRNGWKYLIDDMMQLTDIMQKRYPGLPCFLFGHSMGSLLARLYLPQSRKDIHGCILCGTVGPNPFAKTGIRLADTVVHSKGMLYRSAFLSRLAMGNLNRKIADPQSMFAWLTRDQHIVDLYQSDDKCNFIFTATGFRDLFTLVQRANHVRCFRTTPHDLPILLIAGDKDPIGGYGDGVRSVARMYQAAGQKDVDVIFYKDGRHEIINELNHLDVFGDVSRWLENHLEAHKNEAEA